LCGGFFYYFFIPTSPVGDIPALIEEVLKVSALIVDTLESEMLFVWLARFPLVAFSTSACNIFTVIVFSTADGDGVLNDAVDCA